MKIAEIYQKFGVPPNLREHMQRVYGVISFIEKHWKGQEKVDWNLAKKMALLHDVGNIVKFDFVKYPEFLGSEKPNIEYWKNVQRQMIAKYGNDDNEATRKILTEIEIDPYIVELIFNKRFVHSVETKKSNNMFLEVLYYADLRVLPLGLGTLEDRIADIRKRYNPEYTSRPDFDDLIDACREIEKEIQENLDIPINEITDEAADLQPIEALRYE
jgi:hypothetical protein